MDCYCDDGERPTVYRKTDVKAARSAHKCSECGGPIHPGESYEHVFGVWPTVDGPDTFKTCCRCLALKAWVAAHVPCLCTMHGYLIEPCIEEAQNYRDQAPGFYFGTLRRLAAIERNLGTRPARVTEP